jgi:3-phenylpropionate/cinnamic acid dioxygenase small subunit
VLHDELAIQRVLARYCHTIDDGAFDEFGALWADDAEFVLRGTVTRGRAAIRDAIEAMQPPERRGRHLTMNAVVDVDGDVARAVSDFLFFVRDPGAPAALRYIGRYHDEFARADVGWQFCRREIEFF